MVKAILELEMPESCRECQVLYKELRDGEDVWFVCTYLNKSCPQEGKRPDCPLKLVEGKGVEP